MADPNTKETKDGGEKGKSASVDSSQASEDKKKKKQDDAVNTRPLPIMITLAAAAVSCIMSLMQHVELGEYVGRLVITIIIFGGLGIVIRVVLDRWFLNPKVKAEDEEDAAAAAEEKAAAADTKEEPSEAGAAAEEEDEG